MLMNENEKKKHAGRWSIQRVQEHEINRTLAWIKTNFHTPAPLQEQQKDRLDVENNEERKWEGDRWGQTSAEALIYSAEQYGTSQPPSVNRTDTLG